MKINLSLFAFLLITSPLAADEADFRTDGSEPEVPSETVQPVEEPKDKAEPDSTPPQVKFPVDWQGEDYEMTLDWKLSRRPWAVWVGTELPASLAPGAPHRQVLETAGFKVLHIEKPSELSSKIRKIGCRSQRLHLSWHDGTHREQRKLEKLEEQPLAAFQKDMNEYSRKSGKRRFQRLERRVKHCLQVVQMPKVSEKIKTERFAELREFADRELIRGLPELVTHLEVEIVDRNTQVELRPTVANLDEFRLVPVAADGIAGSMGIELPGMSMRTGRMTVMAP